MVIQHVEEDDDIEAPEFKYKCSNHKYYTNDRVEFEKHLMDPNFSHLEILKRATCFYCGQQLDADELEGVQTRHARTGKATHKECRKKMYEDLANDNV